MDNKERLLKNRKALQESTEVKTQAGRNLKT
jgi:hypothetical protein